MCVPPVPRIGSPVRGEMKHNKTHKKADAPAEVREEKPCYWARNYKLQCTSPHDYVVSDPRTGALRNYHCPSAAQEAAQ